MADKRYCGPAINKAKPPDVSKAHTYCSISRAVSMAYVGKQLVISLK